MNNLKCILTGFKGQFDATATKSEPIHGREVYQVTSECGTVSISVFANTVEQRRRNEKNGGWPLEFYYS